MNTINLLVVLLAMLPIPLNQEGRFNALLALEGTWESCVPGKASLYESWYKVSNHQLQGISYKVSGDDTVQLERVLLTHRGRKILYIPRVAEQNNGREVTFTLDTSELRRFEFINEAHDYPQKIVYEFIGLDSLLAWTHGVVDGKEKIVRFRYKKLR